jgi:transposase
MSKPIERVEIITGIHRRRRYTAEEKVRLVEQTMQPGMTVSAVARLHGVSSSLLFQWRRRMAEGGQEAVRTDEEVVPISRVRELESRVRELERLLGRKTMETEILREALEQARLKNTRGACRRRHWQVPGESRGRHHRRRQIQPGRSPPPARAAAARPLSPRR